MFGKNTLAPNDVVIFTMFHEFVPLDSQLRSRYLICIFDSSRNFRVSRPAEKEGRMDCVPNFPHLHFHIEDTLT